MQKLIFGFALALAALHSYGASKEDVADFVRVHPKAADISADQLQTLINKLADKKFVCYEFADGQKECATVKYLAGTLKLIEQIAPDLKSGEDITKEIVRTRFRKLCMVVPDKPDNEMTVADFEALSVYCKFGK
ncbi:hypothetical protein M2128_002184 [Polynucleobacter sphagniphilus]|uniref:hypothetical protein n=1 Tax=Polynucleobacter sphagniphilus TaxID=1743169 RepID=UPI00247471B6|nr:hypothetical protein [Polynucleobacter sphagniphilus]MDH6303238.1 hypothetical protein [Polynucleobacter sphagniphilus]